MVSRLAAQLRVLENWGQQSSRNAHVLVASLVGSLALVVVVAAALAIIYLLPHGWTNF